MPKDYGWNLAVLGLISNLEPLQHHNHCLGLLSERLNADHSTWRFKPNSKPTVSQVTQEPVAALQYGPNIYIYIGLYYWVFPSLWGPGPCRRHVGLCRKAASRKALQACKRIARKRLLPVLKSALVLPRLLPANESQRGLDQLPTQRILIYMYIYTYILYTSHIF